MVKQPGQKTGIKMGEEPNSRSDGDTGNARNAAPEARSQVDDCELDNADFLKEAVKGKPADPSCHGGW